MAYNAPVELLTGFLFGILLVLWLWFMDERRSANHWEDESDGWRDKYVARLQADVSTLVSEIAALKKPADRKAAA